MSVPADRLGRRLHELLDWLVVVYSLLSADHVAKELDGIQLSVGVLRSRVGDETDLVADIEGWKTGQKVVLSTLYNHGKIRDKSKSAPS